MINFDINEFLKLTENEVPVVRFEMRKSDEDSLGVIALDNVYITNISDSMETVKERAKIIEKLENDGLISINFDIEDFSPRFEIYYNSELYNYFCETVNEGRKYASFLFDMPFIQRGIITKK